MAQHLYLFTGEDSYRLDRELARWTQGFQDKHGEGSVLSFGSEWEVSDILSQLQGGGLFAQQRMLVIDGIPMDNGSGHKRSVTEIEPLVMQLKRLVEDWPDELWVVCISAKPDKRTSDYKWMKSAAEIKEYPILTPAKLRGRLQKEYPDTLTLDQYDQLIERVGTDTRRVLSELDKVQWWMRAHDVSDLADDTLRMIVSGDGEADTFAFVHLVFRDDPS
jgi:DNA polymerase III delta subunit